MSNDKDEWEDIISNIARVNAVLPDAVVVGGTASAIYAEHRTSNDTDFVVKDLKDRFNEILSTLESVSGWKTDRIKPPVLILGNFNGIETGIRQLKRTMPLETKIMEYKGQKITVPTELEILRIKGFLIISRNATRDYIDFVALSDHLGIEKTNKALKDFDKLYPQENNASALRQLLVQLSNPLPYDLKEANLTKYKNLDKKWQDWNNIKNFCKTISTNIMLSVNRQDINISSKTGAFAKDLQDRPNNQGSENNTLDNTSQLQKYASAYRKSGLAAVVKQLKDDGKNTNWIMHYRNEIFSDKTVSDVEKAIKAAEKDRGMER